MLQHLNGFCAIKTTFLEKNIMKFDSGLEKIKVTF